MKRLTIGIVFILTLSSCEGMKKFMNPEPDKVHLNEVNLGLIPDSIYKGEYCVGPVKIIAKVTVTDHRVTNIKLLKHRTGQGQAAEQLTDSIMVHQSICLDAISGATISSKCLLKAVETALTNPKN